MVARGDLGVEIPPEEVPVVQRRIVRRASGRQAGDRRHPDAGIDDLCADAHPGRGTPTCNRGL